VLHPFRATHPLWTKLKNVKKKGKEAKTKKKTKMRKKTGCKENIINQERKG